LEERRQKRSVEEEVQDCMEDVDEYSISITRLPSKEIGEAAFSVLARHYVSRPSATTDAPVTSPPPKHNSNSNVQNNNMQINQNNGDQHIRERRAVGPILGPFFSVWRPTKLERCQKKVRGKRMANPFSWNPVNYFWPGSNSTSVINENKSVNTVTAQQNITINIFYNGGLVNTAELTSVSTDDLPP
jgi:hypothetical protein